MDPGGEILARILSAVYKDRPGIAYWIFASVILAFIAFRLVSAETQEERTLPVLAFIFVAIVVLGRLVHTVRATRVEDSPSIQEPDPIGDEPILEIVPPAQEPPLPPEAPRPLAALAPEKPKNAFPGMQARDFRIAFATGLLCFSLGFLFAYLIGTHPFFALNPNNIYKQLGETAMEFLGGLIIQIICGIPCAFSVFIPFGLVAVMVLNRVTYSNQLILCMGLAFLSFLAGMVIYIPIQFFLFLGAEI